MNATGETAAEATGTSAVTDEQRRYVQAMRDIVLMHEDIGPEYRTAIRGGDKAEIGAAGRLRTAVTTAIAFIASARDDRPEYQEAWKP